MRPRLGLLVAAAVLAGALAPAPAHALDVGVGAWERLCPTSGGAAAQARCLGPATLGLFGTRRVSLRIRVGDATELPAARALGTIVGARGGRAIFVLQGGAGGAPDSGRRRRAYQRLVAAAHDTLGGLGTLEIWNEPNLASQWGSRRPRADHYGRLLCAAHAAAPDARLLLAGLAHPRADRELPTYRRPTAFLRATLRTLRHACPTAPAALAGLSAHSYGTPPEMLARLRALRRVLTDEGLHGLPLQVTEFGWPVAGPRHPDVIAPARQAALLDRVLELLAGPRGAALGVAGVYYFAIADGVPYRVIRGRPHDYPLLYTGLHDASYAPRPAWNVLLDWLARAP